MSAAQIQSYLQIIWASLMALGVIRVIIIVLVIGILSRAQALLGLLATVLFVAYLLHWI